MDYIPENILDEMKRKIDQWMAYISNEDAESVVKRTRLQTGIHNYALLEYAGGRVEVTDMGPDWDLPAHGAGGAGETLTEEQVRGRLVPELAAYMQDRLTALPPAAADYRFTFDGSFQLREGTLDVRILEYVDEAKRNRLRERISGYINAKIETGTYPTKPLETFFLSRHLLDETLFPEASPGWSIPSRGRSSCSFMPPCSF